MFLPFSKETFVCIVFIVIPCLCRDPVHIKPKSRRPRVQAWLGISVRELARLMGVQVEHMFECLLETDYADLYEKPSQSRLRFRSHTGRPLARGRLAGFRP